MKPSAARRLTDHGLALLIMAVGVSGVLGLLSWMNSHSSPPPKPPPREATQMQVTRKKKPPKQKKRAPKRSKPKKARRTARRAAPPPNLGSPLSNVALNSTISAGAGGLDGLGDQLIGEVDRKQVVMTADTVDERPRPVRRAAPQYPAAARRRGLTGTVVVRMLISADGQVERVKVLRAEPAGVFEEAALAAVRQWQYQPARQGGAAVKVWVEQPVRFQLTRGVGG